MRRLRLWVSLLGIFGLWLMQVPPREVEAAPAFAKGADISWILGLEAQGYTFKDRNGQTRDVIDILKNDYQMNAIRIRVWVNPSEDYMNGYMNKDRAADLAVRAKNAGMAVMLTLHYSDSWADPGKQYKPAAWRNYSFQELMDAVWAHTVNVMNTMQARGVTPDWVQIGNETNDGMLWPEGRASTNMRNYAWLVNTGHNAVKSVSSSTKTIVHLSNGWDTALYEWNIGGLIDNGANFDMVAMSLYPEPHNWSTINSQAETTMNRITQLYGKEVIVSEIGMYYNYPNEAKAFIADIISKTQSAGGKGVFYWEPASPPGYNDNYQKGAWYANGMPTGALDGFVSGGSDGGLNPHAYYKLVNRNSGKVLDVFERSTADGAAIVQWSDNDGWNQHWQFVDTGGGWYKIVNRLSGKLIDVEGRSTADGAPNIQWTDNGGWNQHWRLIDAGGGWYKIENRSSGKLIDIEARSTADGAPSIQWTDNGGWNQQWQLVQVQ